MSIFSHLPRWIHLDLKGAPPKMDYLRELLPLFVRMGATGLLMEYEDTFPYSGSLQHLQCPLAYTPTELQEFLIECRRLNLVVVPLIQTFGHLEYVLKHAQHKRLREHKSYSNSICPTNEEAFSVLAAMMDQILDVHLAVDPDMPFIHVGCDEVSHLGVCISCRDRMSTRGWSALRLFCEQVVRVCAFISARSSRVQCLIWDDMLRPHSTTSVCQDLVASGLPSVVQPVVWYYQADAIPDVWSRLSGFSQVWVATAYKGASGPMETTPDTSLHVSNHKLWLAVMADKQTSVNWAGFILTGWSRYDHFAVLCELLPACLPSLALCMRTLVNGEFTETAHQEASVLMGYTGLDTKMPVVQRPRFRAWFSGYNEERAHLSEGMLTQMQTTTQQLLSQWSELRDFMTLAMGGVYKQAVIDDWLGCHVDPYTSKLHSVSERLIVALQRLRL